MLFHDHRSDIHARDKQGRTPFLVACEHSKPDLAKKLLRAGSSKSEGRENTAIFTEICHSSLSSYAHGRSDLEDSTAVPLSCKE